MNRTIKFRGCDMDTGEIVYGFAIFHPWGAASIAPIKNPSDTWSEVYPDSVVQLVGFDKNGAEVYEGDTVVNPRDRTHFKAAMNHIYTVKIYVKEASNNA